MSAGPLLGIFVGGASSRMGSPKGLLPARDGGEALVVRLARLGHELGAEPVLVGRADPYLELLPELRVLRDEPPGIGPLGGLAALLREAGERPAIAVACDMPFVSSRLLHKLVDAHPTAEVLAPRSAGRWQPLFARYRAAAVQPALMAAIARGTRSFQGVFATLEVTELVLSPEEERELCDWDEPGDVSKP